MPEDPRAPAPPEDLRQREAQLAQREADLARREQQVEEKERIVRKNAVETLYDKINVPVKYVDLFIGLCVAAIVVCVILGMLKGRGII